MTAKNMLFIILINPDNIEIGEDLKHHIKSCIYLKNDTPEKINVLGKTFYSNKVIMIQDVENLINDIIKQHWKMFDMPFDSYEISKMHLDLWESIDSIIKDIELKNVIIQYDINPIQYDDEYYSEQKIIHAISCSPIRNIWINIGVTHLGSDYSFDCCIRRILELVRKYEISTIKITHDKIG